MAEKKRWFAKVSLYVMLEIGALMGVPMRPDQIEEMTRLMNDTLVAEAVRSTREKSGDPPG